MVVVMIMIVVMHRRFFNRITEHPCGHAVQHRLALASGGDAVVHALADVAIQELVRIGTEHLGDSVQFLHCASRINEHLLLAENRIEEVLELEVVPQFGSFFFLALGLVCFGKFRFFLLKLRYSSQCLQTQEFPGNSGECMIGVGLQGPLGPLWALQESQTSHGVPRNPKHEQHQA